MPACHAGDRGFESRQLRHFHAYNNCGSVAQLVEQRTENPRVGGSIPSRATIAFTAGISNREKRHANRRPRGGLAKWPNAADCKSVPFRVRWFESITLHHLSEPLAQLVEHLTFNQGVEGSSPSWLTSFFANDRRAGVCFLFLYRFARFLLHSVFLSSVREK